MTNPKGLDNGYDELTNELITELFDVAHDRPTTFAEDFEALHYEVDHLLKKAKDTDRTAPILGLVLSVTLGL